jgi:hypothetical protein
MTSYQILQPTAKALKYCPSDHSKITKSLVKGAARVVAAGLIFLIVCAKPQTGYAQPPTYNVGDKVKLIYGEKVVNATVVEIKENQVVCRADDKSLDVPDHTIPAVVLYTMQLRIAGGGDNSGGPLIPLLEEATSRTQVGFRDRGSSPEFQIRTWKTNTGEEYRARLKEPSQTKELTLVTRDGDEIQVNYDDLDDVDQKYLQDLATALQRQGGARPGMPGGGNRSPRTAASQPAAKASEAPQQRAWKSSNGKYTIEATYVSADDERVKLVKADGDVLEVEIKALSDADKKYISGQQKTEKPSQGPIVVSFAGIRAFSDMPAGGTFTPDPLQPAKPKEPGVQLPNDLFSGSLSSSLTPNVSRDHVLALASDSAFDDFTGVGVVNIVNGKLSGAFPIPLTETEPFAVGSDDKQLYTFTKWTFKAPQTRIDRWRQRGKELSHDAGVILYTHQGIGEVQNLIRNAGPQNPMGEGGRHFDSGFGEPHAYGVVNDDVVYIKTMVDLVLIDLKSGKAIYQGRDQDFDPPAISANRRYLALYAENVQKVLVIDCQKLQIVQTIPTSEVNWLCFSDDGTMLAASAGGQNNPSIRIFDVASAKVFREIFLPFQVQKLYWSQNKYLFAKSLSLEEGPWIFDVADEAPVAAVRGMSLQYFEDAVYLGEGVFAGLDSFNNQIRFNELPWPNWLKQKPNPNDLYVRFRGNEVTIDTGGLALDAAFVENIRKRLTEQVQAAGGRVGNAGRIRVVCSSRMAPPEQRSYTHSETGQSVQVTFNRCINELIIQADGQEVWRTETMTGEIPTSGDAAKIQLSAELFKNPEPTLYLRAELPASIPIKDAWSKIPKIQYGTFDGSD